MTEDHNNHRHHDDDHTSDHDCDVPNHDSPDTVRSTVEPKDGGAVDPANTGRRPIAAATTEPESGRDGIRAVLDAYLSTDLLHAGPGLLPFGRRARERRAHNRAVAEEARRRRDQFRLTAANIATGSPGQTRSRGGAGKPTVRLPVNRRTHRRVVIGLTAVVAAVALVALWWSPPDPRPVNPPTAANSPPFGSTSGTLPASTVVVTAEGAAAGTWPARPPIPPGGVTPVTPRSDTEVDVDVVQIAPAPTSGPTRVDLATPEAAMRAWLARLCPFSYADSFGAAERRARSAMTANGWSVLNPFDGDEADQRARASWGTTVTARESGRCALPVAQISAEAPRTSTSAIVIGAATRVVTSTSQAAGTAAVSSYVEQVSEVRIVRRGTDGLWRVDLPTEGG